MKEDQEMSEIKRLAFVGQNMPLFQVFLTKGYMNKAAEAAAELGGGRIVRKMSIDEPERPVDELKGEGIVAFVSLEGGREGSPELNAELRKHVGAEIGPIARPDDIRFSDALPKTRSGKIMRRILRKIAENDHGALGDTSTLADPGVVDALVEGRRNR